MIVCFIFLIPILINYSIGGMFFITAHRLAEAGFSGPVITATAACWAFFYAMTSLLVGRVTTPQNACRLILGSFVALFTGAVGFLVFPGLLLQFLWIAVSGIAMAFYCTPFQVYMKGFEKKENAGIVASTCKYTGSWSFGLATGAFIFGCLGWRLGYVLISACAVFMTVGLLAVESYRMRKPAAEISAGQETGFCPAQSDFHMEKPDCILPVWFLGGCGTLVIAIVRTLEPALAVQQHISSGHAGAVLALVSILQVVVSLLLIRSVRWYYSWKAILVLGLTGFTGLLLFAFGTSCPVLYAAAAVYGIHSGLFYLLFVYHAIVHPLKSSRYVSVNEAIVGGTTILGCLLGGLIAQLFNLRTLFIFCAGFILLASLAVARSFQRRMSEYSICEK